MLEVRTFRSERKGIRIDLYRKYKHIDPNTKKVKFSYKQLGSFPLSEGYSSEAVELLQPDEIVQLQNWLAEAHFGEQFNTEADALGKYTIRIPEPLYEAFIRLYLEAKRLDIDFIPNKIMLDSLLRTAKLVQHKIDKINGFNSGILENAGVKSDEILSDEKKQSLLDEESKTLFKALLELNHPIGKICTELEEAAKQYGKVKRIPPPQLREWASDISSRNPNKRVKKWCYAIAIDVLHKHGINPITIAKPEKVAEYWAIQHQEKYTLKKAHEVFIKIFDVPNNDKSAVIDAITNVYKKVATISS